MGRSANQKRKILLIERRMAKTDELHPVTMRELLTILEEHDIMAERKSIYGDLEELRAVGMEICFKRGNPAGYYLKGAAFYQEEEAVSLENSETPQVREESSGEGNLAHGLETSEGKDPIHVQQEHSEKEKPAVRGLESSEDEKPAVCRQEESSEKGKSACGQESSEKEKLTVRGLESSEDEKPVCGQEKSLEEDHPVRGQEKSLEEDHPVHRQEKSLEEEKPASEQPNGSREAWQREHDPGDAREIQLKCKKSAMEQVRFRYGADCQFLKKEEKQLLVSVKDVPAPAFYGWIVAQGGAVRPVKPKETVKEYRRLLKKLLEAYKKDGKRF